MYLFRNDSKILILSGSHGSEDGKSGLTDKDPKNVDEGYGFYQEDCELLGIKPGPHKRSSRLPSKDWDEERLQKYWDGVPDITKPAEKEEGFVQDSLFLNMDIRVCNICYYHDNSQKLIQDIQLVTIRLKKNFKNIHFISDPASVDNFIILLQSEQ